VRRSIFITGPTTCLSPGFIGSPQMNFIKSDIVSATAKEAKVAVPGGGTVTVSAPGRKAGEKVTLGMRPEHMNYDPKGPVKATVANVEQLGDSHLIYGRLADGSQLLARAAGQTAAQADEVISLSAEQSRCHLFDENGQRISV